ncbi:hypothetical protein ACJJI4_04390 [Microbulbifer sp. TRSA002]|uniref:hypothetical protein n=1 Tax=Microbulbifer sp. TRSA002 TaxID=3243382 RepID=UPI004039DC10
MVPVKLNKALQWDSQNYAPFCVVRFAHILHKTVRCFGRGVSFQEEMKKYLLIFTIGILSCTAQSPYMDILDRGFGENVERDGITFIVGPWFAPGTEYGYHIGDEYLVIAHTEGDDVETHVIDLRHCQELFAGVDKLKRSVLETAEIFSGVRERKDPEIIVLDGDVFELEYNSTDIMGSITLQGSGNSQFAAPWVDAAYEIGNIAEKCDES